MQLKLSTSVLLVATILLVACGKKSPSYTQFIPKEAGYVFAFDVKSMVTKLESDSLSVDNMLGILKDSSNPSDYAKAVNIWSKFKDAGLDWTSPVFVAIPNFDMDGGHIDVQLVAGLSDAKKLEAFVTSLPEAPKVQKDNDISYALSNNMAIGWTSKAVMILAGNDDLSTFSQMSDSTAVAAPGSSKSPLDNLKKYFALKKDASIASISEFNSMLAKPSDISIFTSTSGLSGSSANAALAMMPKIKDLMEGLYSTSHINFEDGKVVVDGNTIAGKKLADFLKKYAGPEIDQAMVQAYPGTPMGISAFSFKPSLIPGFLAETGLDALANLALGKQGITTEDIAKCFAGDFAVMFGDISISQVQKTSYDGSTYNSTEPTGKIVVSVKVGEKAALDKVLGLAIKQGFIKREGNRLILAEGGIPDTTVKMAIGIENNMFVFSNDEATYKAYVANSNKEKMPEGALAAIKGKSVGFWVDVEKLLNGIPETIFDSTNASGKNIFVKSKSTFKSAWFNQGNFDGKKINGKGELVMVSGKNALPQLVRFLMYVAEETKVREMAMEENMNDVELMDVDSAAVPTPIK